MSEKSEPTPDEVLAWLKAKFWVVVAIFVGLNLIFAGVGLPLLHYKLKDYVNTQLEKQREDAVEARTSATAARVDAKAALEKSLETGASVEEVEIVRKRLSIQLEKLKEKADGLEKSVADTTASIETQIPKIREEISFATDRINDLNEFQSQLDDLKQSVKDNGLKQHYIDIEKKDLDTFIDGDISSSWWSLQQSMLRWGREKKMYNGERIMYVLPNSEIVPYSSNSKLVAGAWVFTRP